MWAEGLALCLDMPVLVIIIAACIVGIVIGALPGLGPVFAIALFVPVTFAMDGAIALVFLSALYAATTYGGSITSILLNAPGTPGSIATAYDGFPLTRKGKGGVALGAAVGASFLGGMLGLLALAFLSPLLGQVSLIIGPSELFMLMLIAIVMVAATSQGDSTKSLFMGFLGLFISFFGVDVITATPRFTFGSRLMYEGVPFVPFIIGVYALSQALYMVDSLGESIASIKEVSNVLKGVWAAFKNFFVVIYSTIIGLVMGILPALGVNAANLLAYSAATKLSKKGPVPYGKGNIRGVIAPEASNNASVYGALIPTFALSVPGNPTAAMFLAVAIMHGMTPGAQFCESGLFAKLVIGSAISLVIILVIGIFCNELIAKVAYIPNALLAPIICVLTVVGAFSCRNQIFDVVIAVAAGFLGYCFMKKGYQVSSLVLGMVLGTLAEANFHRALSISRGSFLIFVQRPITLVLFLILIITILFSFIDMKDMLNKFRSMFSFSK